MVTLSFFKQFFNMSKIRINELARELEVKPNVILDMLPELGVEEKKTHSSSIDEHVAIIIKQRLNRDDDSDAAPRRDGYRAIVRSDHDDERHGESMGSNGDEPRRAAEQVEIPSAKAAADTAVHSDLAETI